MSIVSYVLKRPYTVVATLILICLLGIGAGLRMPVDIFPEINIPVVSVVWKYDGMNAQDIQNRILTFHERQMAALVDDIEHLEATGYYGMGVIKVFLHEGADVTRAISQLASSALFVLKYMPPNITPPMVLRYGATDVPVIQLSLSSDTLPDTKLNDLGQNIIRPYLAVVHGAEVPYPYGGKPRVIMADIDQVALGARDLSPADISKALQRQNVILPSGDVKIGMKDYTLSMNNSPNVIKDMEAFPIKQIDCKTIFMRDVAHVHDGFQVQTNSVSVNGTPGALMVIRKTGGVSTLSVIDGILSALPDLKRVLPAGVSVKPIFDQSIFVKAALNSVVLGGAMAAGLTALMILLFLGNWRLTIIIMASIPISIITAVLVMYIDGQTLNTLTLGGFALAVGILVDNGTVVIENIERNVHTQASLETAIIYGASEVALPTFLATLCISIVFVPIFLLQGTAKYLFSPLSLSVCLAMIASLGLSFTLVPLLFKYLMRSSVSAGHAGDTPDAPAGAKRKNPFVAIHLAFDRRFVAFRETYRQSLAWAISRPKAIISAFAVLLLVSLYLFPQLGRDFFPVADAGLMRLHVRTPTGTRLEQTQEDFGAVESAIRQMVGDGQIDVILDNIGLPYSSINIALSDTATIGPMDGEILIALKEKHSPTPKLVAQLRRELPKRFTDMQFFFQSADIINQVLNFGQPAPIDIRVSGKNTEEVYAVATKLSRELQSVPGIVDSHVFQVPDAPALNIKIDRNLATQFGLDQQSTASSVLITTNSSAQSAPNFWVDPANGVSYPLVVQMPTYRVDSTQDLWTMPISTGGAKDTKELLMNIASFDRGTVPMVQSQYNIRPVCDVHADVQGRDLDSAAREIDKVIKANQPDPSKAIKITCGRSNNHHAPELLGAVFRHGSRRHTGLPVSGYQLPKLDRPAHCVDGGSFRPWRRHVAAVPDTNASERPGAVGDADEHGPMHRQQYSCGNLRQSAYGRRRQRRGRSGGCRLYAAASGPDDGGCDDPGNDTDGLWRR